MKVKNLIMRRKIVFWISISFLCACATMDDGFPAGAQILKNTDLSSSDSPSPWVSISAPGFTLGVSRDEFRSTPGSLFIENSDSLNTNASTWRQMVRMPLPGEGRKITLRAYLKGEELKRHGTGSNIYISLRAFPVEDSKGNTVGRFISSQERVVVEGSFEWRPIELVLSKMPPEVDHLMVYLVMAPLTTGKIFFDDITLTVD